MAKQPVTHEPVIYGIRHRSELSCWIDDVWRSLMPHGPDAVIAAIRELTETCAYKWPEQRQNLREEVEAALKEVGA
jgi:hypothetical protein